MTPTRKKDTKAETVDLTAADFTRRREVAPVEIPDLLPNGKVGVVYVRDASAQDMLEFMASKDQTEAMIVLIGKLLCDAKGSQLFEGEEGTAQIRQIPMRAFSVISTRVMGTLEEMAQGLRAGGDDPNNPFEGTPGSDSPTA